MKRILGILSFVGCAALFIGLIATYLLANSAAAPVLAAQVNGVATTSQGVLPHAFLKLNTYPDGEVPENFNSDHSPHSDWVSYGPSTTLQVPAHSLVTIEITNYDGGEVLNNDFFASVRGVEGQAIMNGQPFTSISPEHVGHTFTLRPAPANTTSDLFVSVPLQAVAEEDMPESGYTTKPNVVTFSFVVGEPGEFFWNCEYPCGDGTYAKFGNAMSAMRYMAGTLTVV